MSVAREVPPALLKLLVEFKCTAHEFGELSSDLRTRAYSDHGISTSEEVHISLFLSSLKADRPSDSALLAKQVEQQERRRVEPWRDVIAKLDLQAAAEEKADITQQQATFKQLAESASLSQSECMTGMYLLYGTPEDVRYYIFILLTMSGQERVMAHNFRVAAILGESFLTQFGAKLCTFPYPLFPGHKDFNTLNRNLLRSIEGAGTADTHRFFSDQTPATTTPKDPWRDLLPPAGGAPFLPVVTGPDGTPVVDMFQVQQGMEDMYRQFVAIKDKVQELEQQAEKGQSRNVARGLTGVRQSVLHLGDILYRLRNRGYPPPHPKMPRSSGPRKPKAKGGEESSDSANF